MRYNSDREYWRKWFPADLVLECFPGQFRNWFYSLLAMSAMLDGRAPFKTLLGHALVRDQRGEEMHKSHGNAIAFDEAAEALGAEVMRYIFAEQNPVNNLNFPDLHHAKGESGLDTDVRRRLLTLWNCYSFFVTYAGVDQWVPPPQSLRPEQCHELDRWILSRLQWLIGSAHESFQQCALFRFMRHFEQFTDELSNWYLRRSRRRYWKPEDDEDKQSAYWTLHTVLQTLVRVLAPVLPFLSEEIYQNLVRSVDESAPESVHLTDYPVVDESWADEDLERRVDCVIRMKELALKLRAMSKVKIRQPLGKLIVRPRSDFEREVLQDTHFAPQILEECNVKELELIEDESSLVKAIVKPNFKTLGPRYGRHMKSLSAHLAQLDASRLQEIFASAEPYRFDLDGTAIEIRESDVELRLEGPEYLTFLSEQGAFAALDTTITLELEQEGIARDFNRQAQDQRRTLSLLVTDRIRVYYVASNKVAEAVENYEHYLRRELLALEIRRSDSLSDGISAIVGSEPVSILVLVQK